MSTTPRQRLQCGGSTVALAVALLALGPRAIPHGQVSDHPSTTRGGTR